MKSHSLDILATLLDILATLWNHIHRGYIVIHATAVILVIIEINSTVFGDSWWLL